MENNNSALPSLDAYLKSLLDSHAQSLREIIREEIMADHLKELQEKLLSQAEARNLFQPKISRPTFSSWANQGLIKEYRIGGKLFYKYSDLMESLKTLKKYKKASVTS